MRERSCASGVQCAVSRARCSSLCGGETLRLPKAALAVHSSCRADPQTGARRARMQLLRGILGSRARTHVGHGRWRKAGRCRRDGAPAHLRPSDAADAPLRARGRAPALARARDCFTGVQGVGSYGGRASARPPDASHHTRMIRNQRSRARLSSSEVTTTGAAHAGTLLTGGHHRLVGTTQQWQRRACSAIHVSPHPPTRRKLEQSVLTWTQRATKSLGTAR